VWVVGDMSGGMQPHLVVLLLSQGVGAVGQCRVVALHCGPAVGLGLNGHGALSALAVTVHSLQENLS
jgi:hypothetical protein